VSYAAIATAQRIGALGGGSAGGAGGAGGSYLEWHGDEIYAHITSVAKGAIDETTAAAAKVASQLTYQIFERRTGAAGESWDSKPASESGGDIAGEFGSYGVYYVYFLNFGTVFMEGGNMLQQAASQVFPTLLGRIAGGVGGRGGG
jgi:hypothetical protein